MVEISIGRPPKTRGVYGYGELPDRITLFRNNMQEHGPDLDALRLRVRITLVHEIDTNSAVAPTSQDRTG